MAMAMATPAVLPPDAPEHQPRRGHGANAFGVMHVAGVTAEDRFTLVHLEFAAVVLVPAALLIVERWPWTEQSAARLGLPARRSADGGPASQAVP